MSYYNEQVVNSLKIKVTSSNSLCLTNSPKQNNNHITEKQQMFGIFA